MILKQLLTNIVLSTLLSVFFVLSLNSHAADWKPQGNVEFIVGSGPGSGLDSATRTIDRMLREKRIVDASIIVVNKPGAGLSISFAYLNKFPGNGHYLAITSPSLLLNKIVGLSSITYSDVTPIAQLISENIAFVVRADSSLKSGKDFVDRLKKDPSSLSIGVSTSLGGANHIAAGLVMQKAGIDLKKALFVPFKSGGQMITAILGNHVDVIAISASVMVPFFNDGRVRLIGISSERRVGGVLATVPTWKEQGFNAVFTNWRGIIGPNGMTQQQITYWENAFGQLVKTEEWKQELEKNFWENDYLNSENSKKFLTGQASELSTLMVDLGLARDAAPK